MICNLKAFGLALVAIFALSAVVASAASAEFTAGADETELTAEALTVQKFITGTGASLECTGLAVHGTTNQVQEDITVEPTYSGCTLTEGGITRELRVDMNGCTYTFTTDTIVHILCPTGQTIKLTAFIAGAFRECLDIHAQTPTVPEVHYFNGINPATGKMDVTVESTVEGVTYERTGLCKKANEAENERNDAHYVGEVTVTGHDQNGNPVDVTKSGA